MPASTTISITNRSIDSLRLKVKPYFLRDSNLKGFGVKINPHVTVCCSVILPEFLYRGTVMWIREHTE